MTPGGIAWLCLRLWLRLDESMQVEPVLRVQQTMVVAVAAVAPFLACAVLSVARGNVSEASAALGLTLLVVTAAATGRRAAGLAAAVSSAVWFNFFLTEPFDRFAVTDRVDGGTDLVLLLVGVAVTEIALAGHRRHAIMARISRRRQPRPGQDRPTL